MRIYSPISCKSPKPDTRSANKIIQTHPPNKQFLKILRNGEDKNIISNQFLKERIVYLENQLRNYQNLVQQYQSLANRNIRLEKSLEMVLGEMSNKYEQVSTLQDQTQIQQLKQQNNKLWKEIEYYQNYIQQQKQLYEETISKILNQKIEKSCVMDKLAMIESKINENLEGQKQIISMQMIKKTPQKYQENHSQIYDLSPKGNISQQKIPNNNGNTSSIVHIELTQYKSQGMSDKMQNLIKKKQLFNILPKKNSQQYQQYSLRISQDTNQKPQSKQSIVSFDKNYYGRHSEHFSKMAKQENLNESDNLLYNYQNQSPIQIQITSNEGDQYVSKQAYNSRESELNNEINQLKYENIILKQELFRVSNLNRTFEKKMKTLEQPSQSYFYEVPKQQTNQRQLICMETENNIKRIFEKLSNIR